MYSSKMFPITKKITGFHVLVLFLLQMKEKMGC
jgi:hypothetical protein